MIAEVEEDSSLAKRKALLFYNDHNSEPFLDMIESIVPGRLLQWYIKYRDRCLDAYNCESFKKDEDFKNYVSAEFRENFDSLLDVIKSPEGRFGNEFGIFLGPYRSFLIKVRPSESPLIPLKQETVFAYAHSKSYELPAIAMILNGARDDIVEDFYEDDFQIIKNLIRRSMKKYECNPDNIGIVYDCWSDYPLKQSAELATDKKVLYFDDYMTFTEFIGENTEAWKQFWGHWAGGAQLSLVPYPEKRRDQIRDKVVRGLQLSECEKKEFAPTDKEEERKKRRMRAGISEGEEDVKGQQKRKKTPNKTNS